MSIIRSLSIEKNSLDSSCRLKSDIKEIASPWDGRDRPGEEEYDGWLRAVFFFYPWKKKSAREKLFWGFFGFFHGQKPFFTPTFWPNFDLFHAHFCFSRALFWIFSRGTNEFSRAEIVFLHGEFYSFNGHILHFFSRASFWFSRAHF